MAGPKDVTFEEFFAPGKLRRTWRDLRPEFARTVVRDVLDHLDWMVTLDKTLKALSRDILDGTYAPEPPLRYETAKSRGAFRVMAGLTPPDALVYRHLADHIYKEALPQKVKGSFFSRRHRRTPIGKTLTYEGGDYDAFFHVWLRYSEYKTQTLLKGVYRVLVTTDISNYFDSIQHDLLLEYIAPLRLPRKAVALLARLLERLKPTTGHSATPRVGLPVDEIDGSRQIAHAFLFEHDQRVVAKYGEDHYVRWMDDQNIGVRSETDARRAINLLTRSLAEQRLTLNTGKTKFLSPSDVSVEFHLETNARLSEFAKRRLTGGGGGGGGAAELMEIWNDAQSHRGKGHWVKVLKRFYGEFAALDSDHLETEALSDLVQYPELDERIFRYYAVRNRGIALVGLFRAYVGKRECMYEGTEAQFFDACASCRAVAKEDEIHFRAVARDFLDGSLGPTSGRSAGKVSALLLLYWSDQLSAVRKWSPEELRELPAEVVRAWLTVMVASAKGETSRLVARAAAHGGAQVARLGVFLSGLEDGSIDVRYPFVYPKTHYPWKGAKFFDARAWLSLELLSRFGGPALKAARQALPRFEEVGTARGELRILARVKEAQARGA